MSSVKVDGHYVWGDIDESEIVRYHDKSGNLIEMVKVNDTYRTLYNAKIGWIPDHRVNLKQIPDMTMREDDVIICAYMKAGTHWVWEIISMLQRGKAEYDTKPKEDTMMEFHFPEEFDDLPSPRVFNTHLSWRYLPKEVYTKGCKIIHIQRNPKDTAVSYYHHLKNLGVYNIKSNWSDYIDLFQNGKGVAKCWFDYTFEWNEFLTNHEQKPPVLSITYEELKMNLQQEIRRLAAFLGIKASDKLIADIAGQCDFKIMKKAGLQKDIPHQSLKKTYSLVYRKGEIGDWKNWFTVAQNEEFDRLYEEKMKGLNMQFVYS